MSYNDGWDNDGPEGPAPSNDYGYQGTMMAFDIAVLQQKYGANMNYHKGANVYVMPHANEAGTLYSCIWDAGGIDTIKAAGHLNSTIDLRPATLQYEEGGGGFVSHEAGIFGGFTIANGVVIENASGASGNDTLIGNDANNRLRGNDGRDTLDGGAGKDVITGGHGLDHLTGGGGADRFIFNQGDTHAWQGADTISDLSNLDTIDLSGIDADVNAAGNQAFHLIHHNFHGVAGELQLRYDVRPTSPRS